MNDNRKLLVFFIAVFSVFGLNFFHGSNVNADLVDRQIDRLIGFDIDHNIDVRNSEPIINEYERNRSSIDKSDDMINQVHYNTNGDSTDWKYDLVDDTTGRDTIGYNPKTDVDYSHRAPKWLRGYWVSETYYKDAGGTDQYQEFGIGSNKYGYSGFQNDYDENNYLFNNVDGIIGIHKINNHRIYCFSRAKDYTGYWDKITKSQYDNEDANGDSDYKKPAKKSKLKSKPKNMSYIYGKLGRSSLHEIGKKRFTKSYANEVGYYNDIAFSEDKKISSFKVLNSVVWLMNHGFIKVLNDYYIDLPASFYAKDSKLGNYIINWRPGDKSYNFNEDRVVKHLNHRGNKGHRGNRVVKKCKHNRELYRRSRRIRNKSKSKFHKSKKYLRRKFHNNKR